MTNQQLFKRWPFLSRLTRLALGLALVAAVVVGVLPVPAARAATINVDITTDIVDNDDGHCSLREAITAANTNTASGSVAGECAAGSAAPTTDTIILPAGTYTLAGMGDDGNNVGDLDILGGGDLTINGAGADVTIINGPAGNDRIFHANAPGATINISDVTIQNGNPTGYGGGISNSNGVVNIANSIISNNTASMSGGAIANLGGNSTMTLVNSTLSGNWGSSGGGLYNLVGTVTIINSTIYNNAATGDDGGGIDSEGTLYIAGSRVVSNTAASYGGGIRTYAEGNTAINTITNTLVSSNTAVSECGGILVRADTDGIATLALDNSTVSNNYGSYGGGVEVWLSSNGIATTTLNNTTVVSNSAGAVDGGGLEIWAGDTSIAAVTLNNTAVISNSASDDGGGIMIWAAASTSSVTLNNCTVSSNKAASDGGGIHTYGNGSTNLNNVTIANNTNDTDAGGDDGGGIYIDSGVINVRNTIVVDNHDGSGTGAEDCSVTGSALFNAQGYNLVGAGTGCPGTGVGDQTTTAAKLGPLADNGGPSTGSGQATFTHALLSGSPAIDAVPLASCILPTDQRGVSRPQGAACDIGAYEVAPKNVYLPLILKGI